MTEDFNWYWLPFALAHFSKEQEVEVRRLQSPGAFLIGLGLILSGGAVLCLLANTAPVAWGAVGTPIRTLNLVTGLPELKFSAMAAASYRPFPFCCPSGWSEAQSAGKRR